MFQAFINNVLREYADKFIVMYLDNILIYSRSKENHIKHVTKVLKVLQKVSLKVKSEKSQFHVKEVSFLNFIVFIEGLKMNSEKI